MSLKFCRDCGTLYDDTATECPKCNAKELEYIGAEDLVTDYEMPREEIDRRRRRSWIQLCIGIPALIGVFYLVFYLFKLLLD